MGFLKRLTSRITRGNISALTAEQRLVEVARRVQNTLTRAGYFHKVADGKIQTVRFSQLALSTSGDYGVLVVDIFTLPMGISISRLTQPKVTGELTRAVGLPVMLWGDKGVMWAVELNPRPSQPLPRRIALDLSMCPHGGYVIPVGIGKHGCVTRALGGSTGHILVGGTSGGGKSTFLHTSITALISRHTPQQLRLALIDPKAVEFQAYQGVPHLIRDIATEVETATEIINFLVQQEFPRRQRLYAEVMAKKLPEYNALAAQRGMLPLPLIVVIIDEVTDLAIMAGTKSAFFKGLVRLISKARSYGIVLVLATQNPKAQVINTLVTSNCSTRIAFRVADHHHSQTVLGCTGAEKLPRTIPGRMLANIGEHGLVLLQGYYADTQECLRIAQGAGAERPSEPGMTDIERAIVAYAVEHMDGAMPINKVYKHFTGTCSKRWLENWARDLEAQGLLTAQPSVTEARCITPQLARLAGLDADIEIVEQKQGMNMSILVGPIRVLIPTELLESTLET